MVDIKDLKKIEEYLFEIPKNYKPEMVVPARVYATGKMLQDIGDDRSLLQLTNVAALPGIQKYSIAMPDIHEGYGFPIGGVAAMDFKSGVVSPGGVGYDINCGMRLLRSKIMAADIKDNLRIPRTPAPPGTEITPASQEDLQKIFQKENSLSLGTLISQENVEVKVDL